MGRKKFVEGIDKKYVDQKKTAENGEANRGIGEENDKIWYFLSSICLKFTAK